MKLIREIPRRAELVGMSADLFGNSVFYYKYLGQKYIKIYFGKNAYKCYKGHDCF